MARNVADTQDTLFSFLRRINNVQVGVSVTCIRCRGSCISNGGGADDTDDIIRCDIELKLQRPSLHHEKTRTPFFFIRINNSANFFS